MLMMLYVLKVVFLHHVLLIKPCLSLYQQKHLLFGCGDSLGAVFPNSTRLGFYAKNSNSLPESGTNLGTCALDRALSGVFLCENTTEQEA